MQEFKILIHLTPEQFGPERTAMILDHVHIRLLLTCICGWYSELSSPTMISVSVHESMH